jgi:hypothetical protein
MRSELREKRHDTTKLEGYFQLQLREFSSCGNDEISLGLSGLSEQLQEAYSEIGALEHSTMQKKALWLKTSICLNLKKSYSMESMVPAPRP